MFSLCSTTGKPFRPPSEPYPQLLIPLATQIQSAPSFELATSLAGTTQHSFIPGRGQVIEYLAADGSTLLWYPGNDRLAPGEWKP